MSLVATEHTTKAFDFDLQELKCMVAEMGGHVEKQLLAAIDSLVKNDKEQSQKVVLGDAMLDGFQHNIENKAITTIATRQPMAIDLREVVAVLRIASDLERIGDLAKNIAKRVSALGHDDVPRQARRGLTHIMSLAVGLLTDALDSFASGDSNKAASVWNGDNDIDLMYTSLFRELLTYMMEDPGTVAPGVHLVFCAKNIERVGDHATNIAESVYYMVEGRTLSDDRPKADSTSLMRVMLAAAH